MTVIGWLYFTMTSYCMLQLWAKGYLPEEQGPSDYEAGVPSWGIGANIVTKLYNHNGEVDLARVTDPLSSLACLPARGGGQLIWVSRDQHLCFFLFYQYYCLSQLLSLSVAFDSLLYNCVSLELCVNVYCPVKALFCFFLLWLIYVCTRSVCSMHDCGCLHFFAHYASCQF